MKAKLPLPPFTLDTAKVQAAEDAWNTRDPECVSLAYTLDSEWRNRSEFLSGRATIKGVAYPSGLSLYFPKYEWSQLHARVLVSGGVRNFGSRVSITGLCHLS